MREDLFEEMYQLEEKYWWHVAKRRLVQGLLKARLSDYKNKVYLDVGCGTGKMLEEMSKWRDWKKTIGLDGSDEALRFCKKRQIAETKKADFEKKLPLDENSVDVITSLDVVEHINGDEKLLKEFWRVVKPNGYVVVTVPAYEWLWTYWDDILGHKRRYELIQLKKKVEKSGLEVEKISYFYGFLLPIAVFFRMLKSLMNKKSASDFITLPDALNNFLLKIIGIENTLIQKVNLPFGLSLVCIARKKK